MSGIGDDPDTTASSGSGGTDPDAFDRLRRRVLWRLPSGLYLLGSRAGGRRNLMTLNWASQLALEPKLVGVSVEGTAVTCGLIEAGGVFALSLLRRQDRAIVRRFVKPVPDDPGTATMGGQAVRTEITGAPVLDDAAAWVDCEVRQRIEVGSHVLFVGEVVGAGFGPDEAVEVLRMEDTRMNYGG